MVVGIVRGEIFSLSFLHIDRKNHFWTIFTKKINSYW